MSRKPKYNWNPKRINELLKETKSVRESARRFVEEKGFTPPDSINTTLCTWLEGNGMHIVFPEPYIVDNKTGKRI